jgi:TolB-like protein
VNDAPAERGAWWGALRRRKVVQWGLLYVAGAWGLLQGLQYVSDAFGWPPAVRQVALLAALIGLPIALVLAWYHGDRGEQRFRGAEVAIIALLFVLGGGIFWIYERANHADLTTEPASADSTLTAETTGAGRVLRLAVLPLENLSPDPANAFFADGLHDEILSVMSATPDLQVVSRTTMRTYTGTRKTVKQIAAELGASHLLDGAVRRAGEQVRLTMQLIDAGTDSNLWSRTFDRQLSDVLSLQSEVATEVATALDVRLLPDSHPATDSVSAATSKAATNPIAYDLYLKGKLQLASFSQMDGPRAFDRLEGLITRAIEIAPQFASLYTLRARALLWRLWYLCDLSDEQWQMIGRDIETATRLAGDTADVLAAQSSFEYYGKMEYPRALEATRAALGQYPNDLDLRELEAYLLRRLGRWDDSIAVFRSLVDREPTNATYVGGLAETLVFIRQYPQVFTALEEFERRGASDSFVASFEAYAKEAIAQDPDAQRRYLDTWRDRVDPSFAWTVEQDYLRNAGQSEALASHLVAAKADFIADSERFGSGLLMPVAGLQGYGRLLQGAPSAPAEARAVSAAAARISRLPSREWNIALLEAHASLFAGDKPRAVEQANLAVELMNEERDAVLGPHVIGAAATVMAWAGEGNAAVQLMRRAKDVPNFLPAWAMVRDPLLAVPLTGNPGFEALKREVE